MNNFLKSLLLLGASFYLYISFTPSLTKTSLNEANLNKKDSPSVVSMPGDELEITPFPPIHTAGLRPAVLNDIASHLETSQVGTYCKFGNINTDAHEGCHGVNANIINKLAKPRQQGLYILDNKAVILDQPKLTLEQISKYIPENLRGSRYQLYFKQQQQYWNDFPLYIFDEAVAYTNGTLAEIDANEKNASGASDNLVAVIEFDSYMIYVAVATEKHDLEYFKNNKQFREYIAYQLRLGLPLYSKYKDDPRFKWDSKLPDAIKQDKEAQECLNRLFGNTSINIKKLMEN